MSKDVASNKLHIGIFGKRSSGKSTLVNALLDDGIQGASGLELEADSLFKEIEIEGIGPCILMDTMGTNQDTLLAMKKSDIALIICSEEDITQELLWAQEFKRQKTPFILVINKIDQITNTDKIRNKIFEAMKIEPLKISAISRVGIERIKEEMVSKVPEVLYDKSVFDLEQGDLVLLVLAQDNQESKLQYLDIVQELLFEQTQMKCLLLTTSIELYEIAMNKLVISPKLIIVCGHAENDDLNLEPKEARLLYYEEVFGEAWCRER